MQDALGRKVNLPAQPKKIVSLVPSQTELLFDIGLENEICGITWFCVHPRELVEKVTKVGGTKKLKLDKIRQIKPDLIIANKEENEKEQVEELANEFPVWVTHVHDLTSALSMIRELGKITNRAEKAGEIAGKIERSFDELSMQQSNRRVLYMIWRKPWMAAGGDTFIHEMLKTCGWQNVLHDVNRYPEISGEYLQKLQPEIILLSSEPYPFKEKHFDEFRKWAPNASLKIVDGEMFSWYGSRLLKSAEYFKKLTDNRN